METKKDRLNIFGTHLSCLSLEEGFKEIKNYDLHESTYVCFPSTSNISRAYKNKKLRAIYNNSFITFADGKFTEVYARLKGNKRVKNVSGYWLMCKLLQTKLTHYFYGCDDDTLNKLEKNLVSKYPEARILGFKSPPLLELDEIENNKQICRDFLEINKLRPDLIWIGISATKQDYLMYHFKNYLDRGILLGVGAVFLYHAGVVKKSPEFLKRFALRWVWRLFQEPVRIYKRKTWFYMMYFIYLILKHDILRMNRSI